MKKILQFLSSKRKEEKGFTLVELIIVIAILAVIAAIAAPNLIGYVNRSKESTDNANAQIIATAAITAVSLGEITLPSSSSSPLDISNNSSMLNHLNGNSLPTPEVSGHTTFYVEVDSDGNVTVKYDNNTGTILYP